MAGNLQPIISICPKTCVSLSQSHSFSIAAISRRSNGQANETGGTSNGNNNHRESHASGLAYMDASAYMHDGSDPNKISPAKTRKGGTPGMFGSEMDGDGGEF